VSPETEVCMLQVSSNTQQVKKFKYLGVAFTSDDTDRSNILTLSICIWFGTLPLEAQNDKIC